MTPERLRQVEEVFLAAAARGQESRDDVLAELCGGDVILRAEVEALLGHDGGPEDRVLEAPLVAPELLPRNLVGLEGRPSLAAGTRVGSYTISGVLGTGGMGSVYVAQQESPRRTVALKLLKPGLAPAGLLRRMELEAELLGRLQHPGIAQIYEAGRADYGLGPQPFFAMELVDGPPLNRYADEHGLGVRERLELMERVCAAVEHAHQKGVIHRDLKPGNILVDRAGQPKILDFGVARATDADLKVTTLQTSAGQLVGTLPYMSPEQVSGNSDEVDTRSDVYALGVVMYQLLAGRLPHQLESRSIPEAARIVRDEAPTPLGTLDRSLRGDVETIVARAMDKDRARRYQSAAALAAEIRRYLRGEPIEAKRDSRVYVLRKQLRRYRTLVAGVCALIISLSAFSIYAGYQADRNRTLAAQEREATRKANLLREHADRQAERLRRESYFSNIGFAQAAYASGDIARMQRVLEACPTDLRGWEWRYLGRISDVSTATFVADPDGILPASISTDGGRLATITPGGPAVVWSVAARPGAPESPAAPLLPVARIQSSSPHAIAAALSPDGKRLALSCAGGEVEFWDVDSGSLQGSVKVRDRGAAACVFSPDGSRLMTVGPRNDLAVVDATERTVIRMVPAGSRNLTCAAVSPDGARVATGDADGGILIWDAASVEIVRSLEGGHERAVRALAFSPDGSLLVSGGNDSVLRVWQTDGPASPVATHRVHSNKISCVAISPDGRWIASAGTDSMIRLTEILSGQPVAGLAGHGDSILSVFFEPRGGGLLSAGRDGVIKRWAVSPGALRRGRGSALVSTSYRTAALSPDGSALLLGGWRVPVVALDSRTLEPLPAPRWDASVLVMDVPSAATPGPILTAETDWWVRLRDPQTGAVIRELGRLPAQPANVALAAGSGLAAASSPDGTVRLWSSDDGRTIHTFKADSKDTYGLCFSPDAARLVTGGADAMVRVWDTRGGAPLASMAGHTAPLWCTAFSPDGKHIISGSEDGTLIVWDADALRPLRTIRGHKGAVFSAAISPDGTRIVSGSFDNTVRLWDFQTGQEVLALREHFGAVYMAAFTPDGSRIVSCANDGLVKVWSADTGDPADAGD